MDNASTPQSPAGQPQQQAAVKQTGEVGPSIEVVLQLIIGLFFFILGVLLIGVYAGALPYSEASTQGFFLVLVALQIISMGKTPFGDVRRSWFVVIVGLVLGVIGILAILFPEGLSGLLHMAVRMLAGAVLVIGGIVGLVRLFTSEEQAKTWLKIGEVLRQVTIALGVMWVFGIIVGIGALVPVVTYTPLWTIPMLIFGIVLLLLAWLIYKASRLYPSQDKTPSM